MPPVIILWQKLRMAVCNALEYNRPNSRTTRKNYSLLNFDNNNNNTVALFCSLMVLRHRMIFYSASKPNSAGAFCRVTRYPSLNAQRSFLHPHNGGSVSHFCTTNCVHKRFILQNLGVDLFVMRPVSGNIGARGTN